MRDRNANHNVPDDASALVYVAFDDITKDHVYLVTPANHTILLHRTELACDDMVDIDDDKSIIAFLQNRFILVECEWIGDSKSPVIGYRKHLHDESWFECADKLTPGEPLSVVLHDTNSRLYAYGDIAPGLQARCEKLSIRRYLQDIQRLPMSNFEKSSSLTLPELLGADVENDDFWRMHYPEFRMMPGDKVIGIFTEIVMNRERSEAIISIDIIKYLRQLEKDPSDIIKHLNVSKEVINPLVSLAYQPEDSDTQWPGFHDRSYHILIVDDDKKNVLLPTSANLQSEGFIVVGCSSIECAKQEVMSSMSEESPKPFDVAFIDIHLTPSGESNTYIGIEYAKWLQEQLPTCAIVLMSAEGTTSVNGKKSAVAGNLMILDYVEKPLTSSRIRKLLTKSLSSKRVAASSIFSSVPDQMVRVKKRVLDKKMTHEAEVHRILRSYKEEIGADLVVIFSMNITSREVNIYNQSGIEFSLYSDYKNLLRYSPVRDVCEDSESWCHTDIIGKHYPKHQNLERLCEYPRVYNNCVAHPILPPSGDDLRYALMAFTFTEYKAKTIKMFNFKLNNETQVESIDSKFQEYIALIITKKYSSQISRQLLLHQQSVIQTRQHPFLIGGIAQAALGHDLDNSLMGATQAIAYLKNVAKVGKTIDTQQVEMINILKDVMNQSLDIAYTFKNQSKAREEIDRTFKLHDAIVWACRAVMREAERRHVTLHYGEGIEIYIRTKPGVLQRVLFNILLNAVQQIEYSFRHFGCVEINYTTKPCDSGHEVIINITDTGPGIHGYRRTVIFEPGSTTRPDGSGMGLAICRQELSDIGNAVINIADTALFCGTNFEVVLPPQLFVSKKVGK
jgi:signal transduction histidine kinase/response regulator of citrate/malate metabolism